MRRLVIGPTAEKAVVHHGQRLPARLAHDERVILQHLREGRFQRSLALLTAISSLLGGLEVTYEHYIGSYSQRIMYTPVMLSLGMVVSSLGGAIWRPAARIALPFVSLLTMLDGAVGFFLHVRGVARKPGGWRLPVCNVVMGPPLFAPLLFATSGFLGTITAFLRREDDLGPQPDERVRRLRPLWTEVLPHPLTREIITVEQDRREGRFQRVMALATALAALCSGLEALSSHYKNAFASRVEWTPILLTPALVFASVGALWNRAIAGVLLPLTSALALGDGMLGCFYHARGILRRPAGARLPLYNLLYGPPIFAPLLFAATGLLGLLASFLRRAHA